MKIAVVIETIDRRAIDPNKTNYIEDTLRNLKRAGVYDSPFFHSIHVVDGAGYTRLQNGARTIYAGATAPGADWVLKLEDDLDFIDGFLDNIAAWMHDHYHKDMPMYSLAPAFEKVSDAVADRFPVVENALREGRTYLDHQAAGFYCAQALLFEQHVALALAHWFGENPRLWDGKQYHVNRGHDLMLQKWLRQVGCNAVRCAIPSFVQHLGEQSTLDDEKISHVQPFVKFPFTQGWSYNPQVKEGRLANV